MPSLTTHFIHSNEVLNNLNKQYVDKINNYLDIYNISSQSHDILFYNSKKDIKKLGHKAHHNETQNFILNIIYYIKKYNLEDYGPAIAYLYGIINHYVLDTTCHPYIFYLTGSYNKKDKSTYKYKGLHTSIEKDIDSIYYKKYYHQDYKYCNISNDIIKNPILPTKLINLINDSYLKTYNKDNIGTIYNNTLKRIKRIINPLYKDKLGIKYNIYKFINIFTNNHLESYSTYHKLNYDITLNKWYHPCTNKENNTNFDDLFNLSITKSINIIKEVYNVLYNNQDINTLKNIIPNIDYSTALDIDNNLKMKYFNH